MKSLLTIMAVLCMVALCPAGDNPEIPKGVTYKPTTPEINDQAREKLRKLFAPEAGDEQIAGMFGKAIVVGPALWHDLREIPDVAKLKGVDVTLQVPQLDANGKPAGKAQVLHCEGFSDAKSILIVWKTVAKPGEFNDMTIRKLNAEELHIFWAMISFDITEPIFIVENKRHKMLMMFRSPDDLTLFWIDDYQHASWEKPPTTQPAEGPGR